jgi:uncharacterized membrane protein HdeD (DUF308 family)
MSTAPILNPFLVNSEEIRRSWGWSLALGIILMALGLACLIYANIATLASVLIFGWFLVISGIVVGVHAFRSRRWGGVFLHLLNGILRVVTGLLILVFPGMGALTVTLVLASFFLVGGLFRAITVAILRYSRWGWGLVSGIISMILGIMLFLSLPFSAMWFIGFAVGFDLLLDGWAVTIFALAARKLLAQAETAPPRWDAPRAA